jgi:hypothetical protein
VSAYAHAQAIRGHFQLLAPTSFALKQPVSLALRRRSMLSASVRPWTLVWCRYVQQRGRPTVDLTLRLDVLAAFAAFAFVGAILLGAF